MKLTRTCKCCGRVVDIADWPMQKKYNAAGEVVMHPVEKCRACIRDYQRARRAALRNRPTLARPTNHWPRTIPERDCDRAFMDWRAVSGGPFQGARL